MNGIKFETVGLIDRISITEDDLSCTIHDAATAAASKVGIDVLIPAFSKLLPDQTAKLAA